MGVSISIVLVVMFLVFMFSLKNISDSAKTVSFVIGIISVGLILLKVLRG